MPSSTSCPADCHVECTGGPSVNYNLQSSSCDTQQELSTFYRPHGTLARTLYHKYLADERLKIYDRNQWYICHTENLPDDIRTRFLQLGIDEDTEVFLDQATSKSEWIFTQIWHSVAKSFLGWFLTQTSINGVLGRGSMFVFSLNQFRLLLGVAEGWRGGALLDLGAGDGKTTEVMASLFEDVYTTEISGPMRWILAKKGFHLLEVETWTTSGVKFDVITCLNLLDRCDSPLSLLRELKAALAPGGKIVVALVLPFNPYVETGRSDHKPTEWLSIQGSTFQEQASSTITDLFDKEGFLVERWSRLPYLCEGDLNQAFYWLDDAVFILRAKEEER